MLGTVLFGGAYFLMVLLQCRPVKTFWDENPRTPGKCWNDRIVLIMTYTASAVNCLADWAFGILPIFIVWSLNLPAKSKILAIFILGFAAIGSTATIVRMFYSKYRTQAMYGWSGRQYSVFSFSTEFHPQTFGS